MITAPGRAFSANKKKQSNFVTIIAITVTLLLLPLLSLLLPPLFHLHNWTEVRQIITTRLPTSERDSRSARMKEDHSMTSVARIPAFYRYAFTWFDPAVTLWASYMDLADPDTVVASFTPYTRRDPDLDMFFQQTTGYTLSLCFLQTVLLRYSGDVRVWKILQYATLIIDLVMLYSLYWGLSNQARLGVASWRAEDWGCILITVIPTVYRICFVNEVGF